MKSVCRHNDLGFTGHTCSRTAPALATQFTVKANNIDVLRQGDPAGFHTILRGRKCKEHDAKINQGSRNVFVERIPMARTSDSFDFGEMFQGSFDVFSNGL